MNIEDFTLEFNGVKCITPCFSIVLYSNIDINENIYNINGVINPYNVFINEFMGELDWCIYSFNQVRSVKSKLDHFSLYSEWLSNPKKRCKGNFTLEFRSGRTSEEWSPPGIFINYERYNDTTLLLTEMALPVEWLKNNDIVTYIKKIIKDYPLSYGYAGWSLLQNPYSVDLESLIDGYLNAWLLRYPGLLAPLPSSFIPVADKTLPDIGWITLLNEKYFELIGGRNEVISKINEVEDLKSEIVDGNLILTIGEKPIIGDINNGDFLPLYCDAGKILSPLHNGDLIYERAILPGFSKDRVSGKKWVNRFFGK